MKRLIAMSLALVILLAGCVGATSQLNRTNTAAGKEMLDGIDKYIQGESTADEASVAIGECMKKAAYEDSEDYELYLERLGELLSFVAADDPRETTRVRNQIAAMIGAESI